MNETFSATTIPVHNRSSEPTMELRWVRRLLVVDADLTETRVLQQKWIVRDYSGMQMSSVHPEWRDIPTAIE